MPTTDIISLASQILSTSMVGIRLSWLCVPCIQIPLDRLRTSTRFVDLSLTPSQRQAFGKAVTLLRYAFSSPEPINMPGASDEGATPPDEVVRSEPVNMPGTSNEGAVLPDKSKIVQPGKRGRPKKTTTAPAPTRAKPRVEKPYAPRHTAKSNPAMTGPELSRRWDKADTA